MLLAKSGIDIFYIDESGRKGQLVFTSVTIPFLREEEPDWRFVWEDYLDKYRDFRRDLRSTHGVPVRKELHANKLARGKGRYGRGGTQLGANAGSGVYRWILQRLDHFLPPDSVITVVGSTKSKLYDAVGLEACLHALFQRMQRACEVNKTNGMTFFDEGHGEYVTAYRKARRYLPTGSMLGRWTPGKATKNKPMDLFIKDGNFKDSKYSLFIQAADLIAYAATMLLAGEQGTLTQWQKKTFLGDVYDDIPKAVLNLNANKKDPKRGIVRV